MAWMIRKLILKAAEKGVKINMTDVFAQQNADDILHVLKELLL